MAAVNERAVCIPAPCMSEEFYQSVCYDSALVIIDDLPEELLLFFFRLGCHIFHKSQNIDEIMSAKEARLHLDSESNQTENTLLYLVL